LRLHELSFLRLNTLSELFESILNHALRLLVPVLNLALFAAKILLMNHHLVNLGIDLDLQVLYLLLKLGETFLERLHVVVAMRPIDNALGADGVAAARKAEVGNYFVWVGRARVLRHLR
jgi:hypothetical protein